VEEQQIRTEAVARFLRGESVGSICRCLKRSRRWLSKWRRRYDPANPGWAASRSRTPKHAVNRIDVATERMVCEVRKRLLGTRYSQRGVLAIQWQLEQLGLRPVPPVWTINRILKRNGLVSKPVYTPRGTPYPTPDAVGPGDVQQLDVVGPRHLTGGGRFYGIHVIDVCSNAVALAVAAVQNSAAIAQAIVAAWQRLGVPRMLQVDNGLAFRGSNRYPRSFGLVLRLSLYLGVEVVFIPEGEPWRNGVVERFNDVYDKLFFRPTRFADVADLGRELLIFEQFHNRSHHYAKLAGQTPGDVHGREARNLLPPDFDTTALSWRDGRVSFIRLTDRHGTVRISGERFAVDSGLVHEYIKGTVDTGRQTLEFTPGQDRPRRPISYHKAAAVRTMSCYFSVLRTWERCPATRQLSANSFRLTARNPSAASTR
jgi:putative transposase